MYPDETRGEIIKAYIQLVPGASAWDHVRTEIRALVRDQLDEYELPREISFVDELPKTTTGKIQRRKLRDSGTVE